jgi:hypothetical protein
VKLHQKTLPTEINIVPVDKNPSEPVARDGDPVVIELPVRDEEMGYDLKDRIGCRGNSIDVSILPPLVRPVVVLPFKWSLTSDSLQKFDASTVHECEERCSGDTRCAAFTFNWRSKRCFLKASCPSSSNVENISGIRRKAKLPSVLDKVGCHDKTLRTISVSGFQACEDECRRTRNCIAFTFDLLKRACYLKANCIDQRSDPTDVTGILSRAV